ncbi:hypothetical protein ACQPZZ_33605 [Microbispora sp. CA-135349]|uniref:hypothetical protein n=1 Tax=Microbispora sp. CA-135349 TaxID=3239953 RepID=UPI003D8E6516
MTEKLAGLATHVERLRIGTSSRSALRVLSDGRTGLALLPYMSPYPRREYLHLLSEGLRQLHQGMTVTLDAYAKWEPGEWAGYAEALRPFQRQAQHAADLVSLDGDSRRLAEQASLLACRLIELPRPPRIPYEAFRRFFRHEPHEIRVLLDWERLDRHHEAGEVRVSLRMHRSDRGFHEVFAPWYHQDHTRPADFGEPGARPWRFSELAACDRGLSPTHQEKIRHFIGAYRDDEPSRPLHLSLATLDLLSGRSLVLDGNHRLAAILRLARESHEIRISEFRISVPLSRGLLPDLTHWPTT